MEVAITWRYRILQCTHNFEFIIVNNSKRTLEFTKFLLFHCSVEEQWVTPLTVKPLPKGNWQQELSMGASMDSAPYS